MLLLASAALAISAPQPPRPAGASARATATIRIISGARLQLGRQPDAGGSRLRLSTVRGLGGPQPAALIEFE